MANIKTFSTFWNSGSNNPDYYDARPYAVMSYVQDKINKRTTYTLDMYVQIAKSDNGLLEVRYNFNSSINGVTKNFSGVKNTTNTSSWGTIYVGSQTYTVNHKSDGTANQISYTINGAIDANINQSWGGGFLPTLYTYTYYHTAPSINVASTISNDTSNSNHKLFGNTVSFNITSQNNAFRHDLTFKVGNNTYTIDTNITSSKQYSFDTSLIEQIVDTSEPTIVVTCATKNNNTLIGTSTTTVYLRVPESYVPTCSLTISDVGNIPSGITGYVKSKSKIRGVISASGSANSTIKYYNSSANEQNYSTQEFETSELNYSGNIEITSTVTDSRGRTASDTKTINVYDYFTPSLSTYSIERCDSDGTLNDEGTYGKVRATYSIAPIGNQNTKVLVVNFGGQTKTFNLADYNGTIEALSSQLFSGLLTNSNHTFNFKIIDLFNPTGIPFTYTVSPAYTTISKLAGGRGVTLGQVATEEGFHSYMDAKFHSKVEGIFDVGDIFLSFNPRNPALKFGGTWELTSKGRMLVGIDTNDSDFNTAGKTGGEKNHTLTINEIPSHEHEIVYSSTNKTITLDGGGSNYRLTWGTSGSSNRDNLHAKAIGGGQAHNNVSPYIVCYIWTKTA